MLPNLTAGLPAYPVFFALAIAIGIAFPLVLAHRAGILNRELILVVVGVTALAIAGAKAYGAIERGGNFGAFRAEATGGYRAPGAILGALLALVLFRRFVAVSPWTVADMLAPGAAMGMSALRIGCLLSGCCFGTLCELPWGVRFPHSSTVWHRHVADGLIGADAAYSLPVHPLQVYFGLWSFAVGVFVIWFLPRKAYEGQVFLLYLFLAGVGKGLLESFRYGPLPHVQYAAFASAIGAGALLLVFRLRRREKLVL